MDNVQPIESFARELEAWLDASDAPSVKDTAAWSRRLGSIGLLAPSWPKEHGGLGLDRERVKRLEEALRARGIRRAVSGGLTMLAPALQEFASEAQLARFLPPIARAEISWAQGYSEPQAGSDLANVQMRCEDRGDHYLVNGQKIWTSGADESDWIFCLVRTDPEASKHEGISFLLVDLASEGIEIAPIVLISGRSPFCQVFFSDVRVPKAHLIGKPCGGWPIAKRLLQHERSMLGSGGLSSLTGSAGRKSLADLAKDAIGVDEAGRLKDDALRIRVARQWASERANRLTGARARGVEAARVSSILKLASSEASQSRYSLLMDLLGPDGLEWGMEDGGANPIPKQWLRSRANTIEGGTSEVQLDIVAKRVLGMTGLQAGTPDQSLASDEDQAMIREAAMQFLAEAEPRQDLRSLRDGDDASGVRASLWDGLSELGWPGLIAPERVGGADLGFGALGVVFEALGRHAVPTPLLSSAVLAASALSLTGGWDDFDGAAGLATGEMRVALGLFESRGVETVQLECRAEPAGEGFTLDGRKIAVVDGPAADALLVVARVGEEVGVFAVAKDAPGLASTTRRWLDGRRVADLTFASTPARALGRFVPEDGFLDALVDRGAAALAAELAGIAAEALAWTVEYLKTREQFDRKLAEFQSLQHRCARLFSEVERSISLVQAALRALDEAADDRSALASAAKAFASETARSVTEEALQLHGGLGMTEEQDIGLFFKRARASSVLFGDANEHYRRLARLVAC
ncbi:MAG: acyl-CoA dehydrogenase family protein [Myxococcota bacterium]